MRTSGLLKLFAAFVLLTFTSAFADEGRDESGKGEGRKRSSSEKHRKDDDRRYYFHQHGYTRLNIPKGHYPPPGECRIWYPDRPPGQQPPPGKCGQVPPDAWVIRHPKDRPGYVHVTVYEPQRPSVVLVVGEFEIGTGAFVRIVLGR